MQVLASAGVSMRTRHIKTKFQGGTVLGHTLGQSFIDKIYHSIDRHELAEVNMAKEPQYLFEVAWLSHAWMSTGKQKCLPKLL